MKHWFLVSWPFAFEFSTSFIIDVVMARYNMAVTARAAVRAANWSVVWATIGALSTVVMLHNNWVLLAGVIGAWFGSYYAVKWGKPDATV